MSDQNNDENRKSFEFYTFVGMALDPIHVGTGGSRLGRVDNTIVRDPVTRIPKIPGSSLAGVMRAYAAMKHENGKPRRKVNGKDKPYYPDCAGQGGGDSGHCREPDCPVCTVFGFAAGKDHGGGFAGLASFSDMHVLLFPVATQLGPHWITCPTALRQSGIAVFQNIDALPDQKTVYCKKNGQTLQHLNIGWLYLALEDWGSIETIKKELETDFQVPVYITTHICVVSDMLFSHIVNSNLEVRTSVAINPSTGAAEERALFTYEALPRSTILAWEVVCRNPKHFKIDGKEIEVVKTPSAVKDVTAAAHSYLEHLGIGGMGSRGMGRLRVLNEEESDKVDEERKEVS